VSTVIIAALLTGEAITTSFVIGAVLVMAGVRMGAVRREPEAAPEAVPETPEAACPEMPAAAC
jgi:drug/metabolite transporter (DMT)-like permease